MTNKWLHSCTSEIYYLVEQELKTIEREIAKKKKKKKKSTLFFFFSFSFSQREERFFFLMLKSATVNLIFYMKIAKRVGY